jgi:hypothetical protein
MVAIATIEEEDAKRPNRERETLIREPTRLINHIKACLVRFAVRGFDTTLRKATDRLEKRHRIRHESCKTGFVPMEHRLCILIPRVHQ